MAGVAERVTLKLVNQHSDSVPLNTGASVNMQQAENAGFNSPPSA